MLFKSLALATLAVAAAAATSFNLVRDEDGYAILPPTEVVLSHLSSQTPQQDPSEYHVINTVADNGEVVRVNLHTHQQARTGVYRRDYNNAVYYDETQLAQRAVYDGSDRCYNEEQDFDVGTCEFDFVKYDAASNCSASDATKYSCIIDVERAQDSSVALKNMDPLAALVRCYKDLKTAQSANATGGACGK